MNVLMGHGAARICECTIPFATVSVDLHPHRWHSASRPYGLSGGPIRTRFSLFAACGRRRPHPQPVTRPTISFSKLSPPALDNLFPPRVLLLRRPAILPGLDVLFRPRCASIHRTARLGPPAPPRPQPRPLRPSRLSLTRERDIYLHFARRATACNCDLSQCAFASPLLAPN
jgi:hypothetical protein